MNGAKIQEFRIRHNQRIVKSDNGELRFRKLTGQGISFQGREGFAHLMDRFTGSSATSKAALVTIFVGLTTMCFAKLTGAVTMEVQPKKARDEKTVKDRRKINTKS